MHSNLEQDKTASTFLVQAYVKLHPELAKKVSNKGLCRAATRNATRCLLNIAKKLRKENVDCLLKCVRKIMHIQIDREEDFGEPHHTVHSEPFFYDASYCKVSNKRVIPLNENGKCVIAEPYVIKDEERKDEQQKDDDKKWKCTDECKNVSQNVSQSEIEAIINLRKAFNGNVQQLRDVLHTCNECPNGHYTKPRNIDLTKVDFDVPISCTIDKIISCKLRGHPLVCHMETGCSSSLRIVRAAASRAESISWSFVFCCQSSFYDAQY